VSEELRFHAGDPAVRQALEDWLAGRADGRVIADNRRRRLVRLEAPGVGPVLVKQFRPPRRHRIRETAKALVGHSPVDREWAALGALHQAGVAVPAPLARADLSGGDGLVVMGWLEGLPLRDALRAPSPERRAVLAALARSLAGFHAAGFAHGDLHAGNVLWAEGRAVLLDLQRARRGAGAEDQIADLGWLDYSLWRDLSTADRLRLRADALGLALPFGAADRRALRAVGAAAGRRADAHARSRTRRCLRPGRRFARAEVAGWRGLRLEEVAPEALAAAVADHREALARRDGRMLKDDRRARVSRVNAAGAGVVVKESPPRGAARALADAWRGSAGRRAWLGGHGLAARGVGAAIPVAFLERRRFGLPLASLVVLEDLSPAEPADRNETLPASDVVAALGRVAVALHRREIDHGDLKASHVYVRDAGGGIETLLLDLDGVRFRHRLSPARRIRNLAQLNASLPDRFPAEARCEAFARYASALPFPYAATRALAQVVAASLARRHRWSGADCALAARASAAARDVSRSAG
jgi:tRNA A-37 threonylcarbamoyl transferase component Bud32